MNLNLRLRDCQRDLKVWSPRKDGMPEPDLQQYTSKLCLIQNELNMHVFVY